MVVCPDCGKEVPEANFCKNCGASLPKESEIVEVEDTTPVEAEVVETIPVRAEEVDAEEEIHSGSSKKVKFLTVSLSSAQIVDMIWKTKLR